MCVSMYLGMYRRMHKMMYEFTTGVFLHRPKIYIAFSGMQEAVDELFQHTQNALFASKLCKYAFRLYVC